MSSEIIYVILAITIPIILAVIIVSTLLLVDKRKSKTNKVDTTKNKPVKEKNIKVIDNKQIITKKEILEQKADKKQKYNEINIKKDRSKLSKKKVIYYVIITLISILATIQTFLLLSLILSFIAHALAVPTTLLTIIAIILHKDIKEEKIINNKNNIDTL